MPTVCFTGHRPPKINEDNEKAISLALESCIEKLISRGYTDFISGMALGADILAAEQVIKAKEKYPCVTLECAVPYPGQRDRRSESDRKKYVYLEFMADKTTLVSDRYTRFCMQKRNQYMVDNADIVVAVYDGKSKGGTANTLAYAHRRNKKIIYITMEGKVIDSEGA